MGLQPVQVKNIREKGPYVFFFKIRLNKLWYIGQSRFSDGNKFFFLKIYPQ